MTPPDPVPSDNWPAIYLHPAERVRRPLGRPERFLRLKEGGMAERSAIGRKPVVEVERADLGRDQASALNVWAEACNNF